jgi:polysaccharide pyruvyl transferase WcaK-like protein
MPGEDLSRSLGSSPRRRLGKMVTRVCGVLLASALPGETARFDGAREAVGLTGLDELFIVGASAEWGEVHQAVGDSAWRKPPSPRLTFVARGTVSTSDLQSLSAASAHQHPGPAFHLPLLGDEENHDRIVGTPGHFDRCMDSLLATGYSAGTTPIAILPLRADTIDSFFSVWHAMVHLRIPYRVTLGNVGAASADQRYWIAETLENLAHHPSVTPSDAWAYAEWAQRLADADEIDMAGPHRVCALGRGASAQEALRAVRDGLICTPRPEPPRLAQLADAARRRKLDKAVWLGVGAASAWVSKVDGARRARPATPFSRPPRVLVIGWYGTETAGDKAILGGIAGPVKSVFPDTQFTVASSKPFYTRRTLTDLGLSAQASVVPYHSAALRQALSASSLVLIGGGPLMDLVEMFDLVSIMHSARRLGKRTLIAGCGVGPVEWPITKWAVGTLLDLSDRAVLRDAASLGVLRALGFAPENVAVGIDPAFSHVSGMKLHPAARVGDRPRIGMAIRSWPWKFARRVGKERFLKRQEELVRIWADACDRMVEGLGAEIQFIPMHTLHIGDDDRWLHAEVRSRTRHPEACRLKQTPASALSVAETIAACDAVVCMRYHSLLYSTALGVPAVAVDYTDGGKVAAFTSEWLVGTPLLKATEMSAEMLSQEVGRVLGQESGVRLGGSARIKEMVGRSRLAGETAASMLAEGSG